MSNTKGTGLAVIGDWRCPDPACSTCRLFDLPSDEAAFDIWMARVREDVRSDHLVQRRPDLLASIESAWSEHVN